MSADEVIFNEEPVGKFCPFGHPWGATQDLANLRAEVARLRTALEQAHALADKWEKSAADSLLLYGVPTTLAPIQAVRELREALRSQDGDTIDG
jgi:hypothetical protein